MRDALQRFAIVGEQAFRFLVAFADDALHFLVDLDGGVFGIVAVLVDFAAQEDGFVFLAVRERAEFAHAPFANHVSGDFRGALDVVACPGGDVAQENFFGRAAAH